MLLFKLINSQCAEIEEPLHNFTSLILNETFVTRQTAFTTKKHFPCIRISMLFDANRRELLNIVRSYSTHAVAVFCEKCQNNIRYTCQSKRLVKWRTMKSNRGQVEMKSNRGKEMENAGGKLTIDREKSTV